MTCTSTSRAFAHEFLVDPRQGHTTTVWKQSRLPFRRSASFGRHAVTGPASGDRLAGACVARTGGRRRAQRRDPDGRPGDRRHPGRDHRRPRRSSGVVRAPGRTRGTAGAPTALHGGVAHASQLSGRRETRSWRARGDISPDRGSRWYGGATYGSSPALATRGDLDGHPRETDSPAGALPSPTEPQSEGLTFSADGRAWLSAGEQAAADLPGQRDLPVRSRSRRATLTVTGSSTR